MVKAKNLSPKAKLTYTSPEDKLLRKVLIGTLEFATGRKKLERMYTDVRNANPGPREVWDAILGKLEVHLEYPAEQLAKAPASGAVVFVSNHPFGVVDGLILGHLISQVRSDFKVLVNDVLCREPMLNPFLLPIDFRQNKAAMQTNIQTRKQALEILRSGGAVAVFPAGGVATATKPFGRAEDLEWKRFTAKLIQQSRATVIPLFFHGQNSRVFQLVSQINMNLRLGMLLNEVRNKIGRRIEVSIGDPIPHDQLAELRDRQQLLDHLRDRTLRLGNGFSSAEA